MTAEELAAARRSATIRGVLLCLASTTLLAFNTVLWSVLFETNGIFSNIFPALPSTADALVTTLSIESAFSLVLYVIAKPAVNALSSFFGCNDDDEDEEEGPAEQESSKKTKKTTDSIAAGNHIISQHHHHRNNEQDETEQQIKEYLEDMEQQSRAATTAQLPSSNGENGEVDKKRSNGNAHIKRDETGTEIDVSASVNAVDLNIDDNNKGMIKLTDETGQAEPQKVDDAPAHPGVSRIRYNALAFSGALLYFGGFCCRLIGISYLSAITFAQMEPTRIVYIFFLKFFFIVVIMPKLERWLGWRREVGEALKMTVLDDGEDGDSARRRLFRLPVSMSMLIISASLAFQMYATLTADEQEQAEGGGEEGGGPMKTDPTSLAIGFSCLFICLLLNALENVWWEVVSLHPTVQTLPFLQRHDQYLLAVSLLWSAVVLAIRGYWFGDFLYTMLVAAVVNSLTVPAANALEAISLERIDAVSFSSIQELCYPFITLIFSVMIHGKDSSLPTLSSWIAMGTLSGGIILFHCSQTIFLPKSLQPIPTGATHLLGGNSVANKLDEHSQFDGENSFFQSTNSRSTLTGNRSTMDDDEERRDSLMEDSVNDKQSINTAKKPLLQNQHAFAVPSQH